MVIQHLKQTGKLKKLNKWVLHELTANQNLLLFYTTITNHLVIVMCNKKWILYNPG